MLDNRTQIISYKHNGVLHRVWQYAYVIRQTSDMIVLVNDHTSVIDGDGRRWKTKEPAVCYFFKNYWFNIICMPRYRHTHHTSRHCRGHNSVSPRQDDEL